MKCIQNVLQPNRQQDSTNGMYKSTVLRFACKNQFLTNQKNGLSSICKAYTKLPLHFSSNYFYDGKTSKSFFIWMRPVNAWAIFRVW